MAKLRKILSARWFRLAVALAFIALQLWAVRRAGLERINKPFDAAPTATVKMSSEQALTPDAWDRLLVSRWDSLHYIDIELRGFSACPPQDLRHAKLTAFKQCAFGFYPGYAMVGRALRAVLPQIQADYALWYVALLSSLALMYLWTGPALVSRLGLGTTYLALLLMNTYVTGFQLVTVETEALTLLCTVGAFVALRKRWYVAGALVAGLTSSVRITGLAVGGAFAAAMLLESWRTGSWRRVAQRLWLIPVCAWGQLAISWHFYAKYKDPFLYMHAHGQEYNDNTSLKAVLWPAPRAIGYSIAHGMHEGVWVGLAALFLALGLNEALRKFPISERVYWALLTLLALGVAIIGSAQRSFIGMNRYFLVAPPLFFATAMVLRRRPVALGVWLAICAWHYWNVDLCVYVAHWDALRLCILD